MVPQNNDVVVQILVKWKDDVVVQILVKWKDKSEEEATWEDYWPMIEKFPTLDLETRSVFKAQGDVTTIAR